MSSYLRDVARKYPVVTVLGPRQSGKTTLCQTAFPHHRYVNLEAPDVRDQAREDPRGFLRGLGPLAVIDEIQRAPELPSYLQVEVDRDDAAGRYILTGSENVTVNAHISQSLAGRTALLTLLPFSLEELPSVSEDPFEVIWRGGYPRIVASGFEPVQWMQDYVATYVERDVRQLLGVADTIAFTTFLRLCATRTGQELNFSSLGSDAGVSHNTARAWLSVLEATYVCWRLPPWTRNARKRLVKAPKLHFFDSGLLCYLLGIRSAEQLRLHPLRGAVFETWVVSEALKWSYNRGKRPAYFHYREVRGGEVDLLIERALELVAVEVKSGATIASDAFDKLSRLDLALPTSKRLVFAGEGQRSDSRADVVAWRDLPSREWV